MNVAFRVDASLAIGSGHVMRCLTLADHLRYQGIDSTFLCRVHEGNLIQFIQEKAYHVVVLPLGQNNKITNDMVSLTHADWLGASQLDDAKQCEDHLKTNPVDYLIVDHYALDKVWELALKDYYKQLMVIDDLADREHSCDLLLDQTYGISPVTYQDKVPSSCQLLLGSQYALLRPEFRIAREKFINDGCFKRDIQQQALIQHILINLGGVDADNLTTTIISQLQYCVLSEDVTVTVVMGTNAPHLLTVKQAAESSRYGMDVQAGVSNMAELMSKADLAIGAAGATTWERCALGLPSIQLVLSFNQLGIAQALDRVNAVILLDHISHLSNALEKAKKQCLSLSNNSAQLVDALGVFRVTYFMIENYLDVAVTPYTELSCEEILLVLRMRNHPNIRCWMHQTQEIKQDEHLSFVDTLKLSKDRLYFLVKQQNDVLGTINFSNIQFNQSADFGLFANPFLEKRGCGKKLIAAALNYARNQLQLKQLSLAVYCDNTAAIKLYKSVGFYEMTSTESEANKVLTMVMHLQL